MPCCQRSVLVSIHSQTGGCRRKWSLSKICAGVNSQHRKDETGKWRGCQRSVLVSIHSAQGLRIQRAHAVKDLCWCQFTADNTCRGTLWPLSKICAGVNSQQLLIYTDPSAGCQRSVLVSIHSRQSLSDDRGNAVKDLCWCQFTALAQVSFSEQ